MSQCLALVVVYNSVANFWCQIQVNIDLNIDTELANDDDDDACDELFVLKLWTT